MVSWASRICEHLLDDQLLYLQDMLPYYRGGMEVQFEARAQIEAAAEVCATAMATPDLSWVCVQPMLQLVAMPDP